MVKQLIQFSYGNFRAVSFLFQHTENCSGSQAIGIWFVRELLAKAEESTICVSLPVLAEGKYCQRETCSPFLTVDINVPLHALKAVICQLTIFFKFNQ